MVARLTQVKVKKAFSDRSYNLTSVYLNEDTPLNFICAQGHPGSIRWYSFKRGGCCRYCSGSRLTQEKVKEVFKDRGYTLISTYVNRDTPLEFICPQGHADSILWESFKRRGNGCKYCSGKLLHQTVIEEVTKQRGFQLISIEASPKINSQSIISCICPNGHSVSMVLSSFTRGHGCIYCSSRYTQSEIERAFAEKGYKLMSDYKKCDVKLDVICPNGHHCTAN